jgi:hypothetical protein
MKSKLSTSLRLVVFTFAMGGIPAPACLWDSETLAQEKARLAGVMETMTGNFPRHSKEFHEWRKTQCELALAKDPKQTALYDDLAVSQHKLGDHKAAIATMFTKDKLHPMLYETYSNIGTFYLYDGNLKEADVWIGKAVAMNAFAHFGREKYQKWLIEWLLAEKPRPKNAHASGFAHFILWQQKRFESEWSAQDQKDALRGILGMMRFADFDNPLLLEVLGDVLASGGEKTNSRNLAVTAYELATRHTKVDAEKLKYQSLKLNLGKLLEKGSLNDKELSALLAKGQEFAASIRRQEMEWIQKGVDVSLEYQRKYLKQVAK